jgi:hypothetical protein
VGRVGPGRGGRELQAGPASSRETAAASLVSRLSKSACTGGGNPLCCRARLTCVVPRIYQNERENRASGEAQQEQPGSLPVTTRDLLSGDRWGGKPTGGGGNPDKTWVSDEELALSRSRRMDTAETFDLVFQVAHMRTSTPVRLEERALLP